MTQGAAVDPRGALLGVYKVPGMVLVRGAGCRVEDEEGRSYLDFTAGIGVNALGHGSPVVREAVLRALETGLIHTSNLFRTRPAERLAERLVELTFPGRVFFCNSGAEAGEAAFKFARRWARASGAGDRTEFVSFFGAFHGRLFGTLAATDRPDYRAPFEPLMPGVHFARVGELASVEGFLSEGRTAAVVLEPIQGEGGVNPVPTGFLRELRALCDEHGVLLILDEIQCGMGRTGSLFAFQEAGIVPDLLTLAKPLGGGLPMGAVVVSPAVGEALRPGEHGTTFGGGPLVSTVALAVLERVADPDFLARVRQAGGRLEDGLRRLASAHPQVRGIRGRGLMWGMELDAPVADVLDSAREAGLLLVGAGPRVIRFLPPLVVTDPEVDEAVEILGRVLGKG